MKENKHMPSTRIVLIEKSPFKILVKPSSTFFYVKRCINEEELYCSFVKSGIIDDENIEKHFSYYFIIVEGDFDGFPLLKSVCEKI